MKVWDAQTGQLLLTLREHEICSVAFSPDGARIVTGNGDAAAKVWDAQTGQELLTLKGHAASYCYAVFSPNGKQIVTAGGSDGTAKVWDAITGHEVLTLKADASRDPFVWSVAFSPDGKRIVTGSADGTAKVWFADDTRLSEP